MTFASEMAQVQMSGVPELYIISGGGYAWRYTSSKSNVTFLGSVYQAATISRSSITVDRMSGSSTCKVTALISDPLRRFLSAYPLSSTRIQIYQAIASDLSSYGLLFDGKVKRATIQDAVITAEVATPEVLSVRIPKIVYQSYCNWQVFDCNCGLSSSLWEVGATVTFSAPKVLTSPTFGAYGDTYFSQGRAKVLGEFRWITRHDGNNIHLQIPFGSELVSGGTVQLLPGCDGSPDTCRNKFNNFYTRWCGMKYIPSHNPVMWGFK